MSTINPVMRRDGFALPVALLAIMVIGALVTGGFYAASRESRMSTSTDLANQAFYLAEYGLEEALGSWKNDVLVDIPGTRTFAPVPVYAGGEKLGTYTLMARRIGTTLFLVTAAGRAMAGPSQAVRRVGSMVRVMKATPPYPTALTVFGGLTTTGRSRIRGEDSGGPGCAAGEPVAGVMATADSLVHAEGQASTISGDPPITTDPALTPTLMSEFGPVDIQDLIDVATHTYPDGADLTGIGPVVRTDELGNERCDDTIKDNWGDPTGKAPCGDYMPIIHAQGDLNVRVGTGQGILIVDGDLYATGNYDFYGVVIVKGSLYIEGTGNHIEGSVLIMGDGELSSLSTSAGSSLVQYSRCRVERAFDASLRPRPLAARSWMDFTAVTRGT